MKAKKFEQKFDDGGDITASLDLSKAKRVLQAQKRGNVERVFPNITPPPHSPQRRR